MTDKELLEKRLTILKKIDRLLRFCKCDNQTHKHTCKYCDELTKYGNKLLILSKPRKQISTSGEITLDVERKVQERPQKLKSRTFTVEEYAIAKFSRVSDEAFRKTVNVGHSTLVKWKKAHKSEIFIALNNLEARENRRVRVRGMLKG